MKTRWILLIISLTLSLSQSGKAQNMASPASDKSAPIAGQPARANSGAALAPMGSLPDSNPALNKDVVDSLALIDQSRTLSDRGDAFAKKSNWKNAASQYQQALALWPDSPYALYGLADCDGAAGDRQAAINDYRKAIYQNTTPPHLPQIKEVNTDRLMKYVLLLGQDNQMDEAVRVYNYAIDRLNYDHDRQRLEVLLPELGDGPGQVGDTPQDIEAMVRLAIGVASPGYDLAQLRQAVALAPDSAVAQFYLGKCLYGPDNVGAKTALQKAIQLGDAQTQAAAQSYLQFIH